MGLLDDLINAVLPLTQTYTKTVTVNQNVSSSAGPVERTIAGDEPEHICIYSGVVNVTTAPSGAHAVVLPLDPANGSLWYPTNAKFAVEFQEDCVNQPLNVTFGAVFTPVAT